MDIKNLQKTWDEFGKTKPLWAIASSRTDWSLEEFFASGVESVNDVMRYVDGLGHQFDRGSALDFGCGVGRLSQAMIPPFDEVWGVDIAPSMIEQAREYNRHGERCRYFLHEENDLGFLEPGRFDFVLSLIVLQHMKPVYAKEYIREFVRVLKPGGLAVFQVPAGRAPYRGSERWLKGIERFARSLIPRAVREKNRERRKKRHKGPKMEMYAIPAAEIRQVVSECGARMVDVQETLNPRWRDCQYCITKG